MTRHVTAFEIERPVPAGEAVRDLGPAAPDKADASAAAPAPAAVKKFNFRKLLMVSAAVAVLAGATWYGWDYWTVGRYLVSTDDAYVKADNTTIAPKVSGYLHEVLVGDNERVKAGQVLARIDERDFTVALDQAKADVAAAQAAIASKQAQLEVQQAVIDAARATIDVDKATVTFAAQENKRYTDLATTGFGSVQNAQQAASRNAERRGRDRARYRQPRVRPEASRPAEVRNRAGECSAGARQSAAEPGRTQSRIHLHHRADRRRRRQPKLAHRPVRAGRHPTDVGGADRPAPMWWRTSRKPS